MHPSTSSVCAVHRLFRLSHSRSPTSVVGFGIFEATKLKSIQPKPRSDTNFQVQQNCVVSNCYFAGNA